MLSQDRINTSTVDSVYTRIDHPVEVQRGEKVMWQANCKHCNITCAYLSIKSRFTACYTYYNERSIGIS